MVPNAVALELYRRALAIRTRYEAINGGPDWVNRALTRMLDQGHFFAAVNQIMDTSNHLLARRDELLCVMQSIDTAFRGSRVAEANALLERAEALVTLCEHHQGSIESDLRREMIIFAERN